MKKLCAVAVLVAGLGVDAAIAAVPVTFQSGTAAKASEVNQNFQNLDQRVNGAVGEIIIGKVSAESDTSTSVISATCPAGSTVISADCGCSSVSGSRNFGVLFGCETSGNSAITACFSEGTTFNPAKPGPQAQVAAVCAVVEHTDGTLQASEVSARHPNALNDELQDRLNQYRRMAGEAEAAMRSRPAQ